MTVRLCPLRANSNKKGWNGLKWLRPGDGNTTRIFAASVTAKKLPIAVFNKNKLIILFCERK